jgi:CRISPR-associated protein Cmr3
MNIVIHAEEPLVFRDGRPFGDPGHVNGGLLRWPWPSTLVGMLRTRIGLSRDKDFFQPDSSGTIEADKLDALKTITARRIMPLWQEQGKTSWEYLYPAPADALCIEDDSTSDLQVHGFSYEDPCDRGGIDLPWRNWRIPIAGTMEKPAKESPELWFEKTYFNWLENGVLAGSKPAEEIGVHLPLPEVRMHTAIDPGTGTVKTGQLFASHGIRLAVRAAGKRPAGRLGFGVELENTDSQDAPFGPCFLGGERRVAVVERLQETFPQCPDWFAGKRYLRLVLLTPGDFGSWAPDWLRPDPTATETSWRTVPGSDITVRLCSAFVPRWQPVSGWDYAAGGPKATRKLVPAGAVYVVELQDPAQSRQLADLLWGRSMADNLAHPDGCGAVCLGNVSVTT